MAIAVPVPFYRSETLPLSYLGIWMGHYALFLSNFQYLLTQSAKGKKTIQDRLRAKELMRHRESFFCLCLSNPVL